MSYKRSVNNTMVELGNLKKSTARNIRDHHQLQAVLKDQDPQIFAIWTKRSSDKVDAIVLADEVEFGAMLTHVFAHYPVIKGMAKLALSTVDQLEKENEK
jgi:hypothetical protein